jgi:hypothetical protein
MTITLETTRVDLAVDPLVVLMNGREGQAAQRMLLDQDGPDSRMGFDHFIFRLGEFAALSQNAIWNTDFADGFGLPRTICNRYVSMQFGINWQGGLCGILPCIFF